jgi:Fe-S oxidoreductase
MNEVIRITDKKSEFKEHAQKLIPNQGNLDLCFTCGTCASGCPATGLEDMDPRKFLRMVLLGLDEEVTSTPWVWMCTMCQRCIKACPMEVDIPQLVYRARETWPRETRPVGILKSCDVAQATPTYSAMGANVEDWKFVVEDVAEEVRDTQPGFENLVVPMDKQGAMFFLNQNSREPVTEPDEMIPLWKILNLVGADWTYPSVGWAGENYCMFLADDAAWEKQVRDKVKAVEDLGCKYWLNTE